MTLCTTYGMSLIVIQRPDSPLDSKETRQAVLDQCQTILPRLVGLMAMELGDKCASLPRIDIVDEPGTGRRIGIVRLEFEQTTCMVSTVRLVEHVVYADASASEKCLDPSIFEPELLAEKMSRVAKFFADRAFEEANPLNFQDPA